MREFVIVGMPRTGSTLLLTGLGQHPEITGFGELFHELASERTGSHAFIRNGRKVFFDAERDDAIEFLKEKVFPAARPGSKAVGFKLFLEMVRCPGTEKLLARLKAELPDLRVIHIVRRNYLEVLVSRKVATATKRWIEYIGQKGSDDQARVRVEPERARIFFSRMKEADRIFESVFSGANYLKLEYSALSADFPGEMDHVYEFLGVAPFRAAVMVRKQISQPMSQVVENYDELRRVFCEGEYREFFSG
jgi:LPS sulfotransferase NodH